MDGSRRGVRSARLALALTLVVMAMPHAELHAERLPIRVYTVADGLVRDQIHRIVRDARGFLWFCTPEGLSRFDGYGFKDFIAGAGSRRRSVRDLIEADANVYWVATSQGVVRLDLGTTAAEYETVFSPADTDEAK